jgi:surface antigen
MGLAAGAALIAGLMAPGTALAAPLALIPGPEQSDSAPADTAGALPYLQCVPYARQVSGIHLYGDAHTWWNQAAGRYERGFTPKAGAVMSFHPYGAMRLGHVAMVSRVLDSRTVLLRHANWSPINGTRGQKEDDVRAVDVSDANDWSQVRVWYGPIQGLGTTHWPVDGFIYNRPPQRRPALGAPLRLASATTLEANPARQMLMARGPSAANARGRINADFLAGVTSEAAPSKAVRATPPRSAAPARAPSALALAEDPIGRIIASRMGGAAGTDRLR